jgi:hypothetical protein
MTTALFIAALACIAANVFVAVADYAKAGFVMKNSAEVHVPESAVPCLATLKLAGALGLVAGLTVLPWLGVAAGIGLIVFFIGAVIVHVRARVVYNIAFPGFYLLLAVAATACMVRMAV